MLCGRDGTAREMARVCVPGSHLLGRSEPSTDVYAPLGHTRHEAALVPPVSGLNLPAAAKKIECTQRNEAIASTWGVRVVPPHKRDTSSGARDQVESCCAHGKYQMYCSCCPHDRSGLQYTAHCIGDSPGHDWHRIALRRKVLARRHLASTLTRAGR